MIKRYRQFVNESIEDYFEHDQKSYTADEITQLRDDWKEAIIEVLSSGPNYSTLCKREDQDPEEDYKEHQKEMDAKGFTFDVIKKIFSKEADKIVGKWAKDSGDRDIFVELHQSSLEEQNGDIDTYLYFTVKRLGLDYKRIELGGPSWSGIEDYPEEAIIRYSYGYHKTKYGQLMMEQLGITQKEFEEYASKGFCIELINNWHDFFSAKMEDFVIIEEDRIVIFTKKLTDYLGTSIEEVNQKLTNFLKIYDFIEYDITENEFLIHCESEPRYFLNAS
jgi:hypothetical protein